MPRDRPDKQEYEKRMMCIQGWIIEGVPSAMIIQQVVLKSWVKSERHAYIYLEKARKRWIQFEDGSREDKRKLKVQELKKRINGMNNEYKGTPAGMRAILAYEKEIIRLEGLYFVEPNKPKAFEDKPVDVKGLIDDGGKSNSDIDYDMLSDEVLEAIVAAQRKSPI